MRAGAARALRLRGAAAVDAPGRRRRMPGAARRRRPRRPRAARTAADRDRITCTAASFDVGEGETVDLQLSWFPAHLTAPEPARRRRVRSPTPPTWWRAWVRAVHRARRLRRGGAAVAARAAAAHPRGHRRHRRRGDDQPARGLRRRRATGTTATSGCAMPRSRSRRCCTTASRTRRRRGGTGCCARSPATRPTCRSCTGSPGERRLTEWEVDSLPGYDGSSPGAGRQRGIRAVPGRRLRRGDDRARRGAARGRR